MTQWHIYRNNRKTTDVLKRGEFMGVQRGALQGSVAEAELAALLGEGEFIAVSAAAYPKRDGVPPIHFISITKAEVEVKVR